MQATICFLSERKEENSFLTSPLVGLLEPLPGYVVVAKQEQLRHHRPVLAGTRAAAQDVVALVFSRWPLDESAARSEERMLNDTKERTNGRERMTGG